MDHYDEFLMGFPKNEREFLYTLGSSFRAVQRHTLDKEFIDKLRQHVSDDNARYFIREVWGIFDFGPGLMPSQETLQEDSLPNKEYQKSGILLISSMTSGDGDQFMRIMLKNENSDKVIDIDVSFANFSKSICNSHVDCRYNLRIEKHR